MQCRISKKKSVQFSSRVTFVASNRLKALGKVVPDGSGITNARNIRFGLGNLADETLISYKRRTSNLASPGMSDSCIRYGTETIRIPKLASPN